MRLLNLEDANMKGMAILGDRCPPTCAAVSATCEVLRAPFTFDVRFIPGLLDMASRPILPTQATSVNGPNDPKARGPNRWVYLVPGVYGLLTVGRLCTSQDNEGCTQAESTSGRVRGTDHTCGWTR